MKIIQQYLLYLCIALALCGCSSQTDPISDIGSETDSEVLLCIQVNVNDAVGNNFASTRDGEDTEIPPEFESPAWPFEKMHTLRVIIVRPDNTVEHNRFESLPLLESVNNFGQMDFQVSVDQGTFRDPDHPTQRIETKRVYLIANEDAIQPEDIVTKIKNLKVGDKIELSDDGAPAWIIENKDWEGHAVPMINNEGKPNQDKMFVPMTEFFNVDVKFDIKNPSKRSQYEKLFVTRALVKFEFSVEGEGIEALTINTIEFGNLNQKEYLFPYRTKYSPDKYTQLSDADKGREIVEYTIPTDNLSASYRFTPDRFGFGNGSSGVLANIYNPQLYFCESQTFRGDADHNHIYQVKIGGNMTIKGGYQQEFDFDPKPLPNLQSLPRNTVVKIHFIVRTYEAQCVVTVFPYTAVNLNPQFGFGVDETEASLSSSSLELVVGATATITPNFNFDTTNPNVNTNLIWTTSDSSVVKIEPADISEVTINGDTFELSAGKAVKLIAVEEGDAIITAYARNGQTATCKVTVKKAS